jgi:hypothetical protein
MKWAFRIVLVVVAGAVSAFGIYTRGWHSDDSGDPSRARAYAETLAAQCDPDACEVSSVTHVSGNDWKVVLRNPKSGGVGCVLVQADRFAERADSNFSGASRMSCAEERSATTVSKPLKPKPPPIGPEWWDQDRATENVGHSKWASDNSLDQAVFDCLGQGRVRAEDLYRRFACTYSYGGPNSNKSGRIEIVTTGRDSFRVVSMS